MESNSPYLDDKIHKFKYTVEIVYQASQIKLHEMRCIAIHLILKMKKFKLTKINEATDSVLILVNKMLLL